MDDIFKEFNETDWRTQWTLSALRGFDGFWKETEKLVAAAADAEEKLNRPDWNPKDEEEYWEYRSLIRAVRHHHDEVITPTFRYAVVVTLFAILERELRRAADYIAAETKVAISYKGQKGSVIPLVARFIKTHKGISIQSLPGYGDIADLQKVRDCIVHCYGDIALSRDHALLKKLSTRARGLDAYPGTEMEIAPAFIERAMNAHVKFFTALFNKLGWKIKAEWLENRRRKSAKVSRE